MRAHEARGRPSFRKANLAAGSREPSSEQITHRQMRSLVITITNQSAWRGESGFEPIPAWSQQAYPTKQRPALRRVYSLCLTIDAPNRNGEADLSAVEALGGLRAAAAPDSRHGCGGEMRFADWTAGCQGRQRSSLGRNDPLAIPIANLLSRQTERYFSMS